MYGSTVIVNLGGFFSFSIYTQPVGLLWRGISSSQGQHKRRINAHRHPCLEWDSNPLYQCSSGRRRVIPLWSAQLSSQILSRTFCNISCSSVPYVCVVTCVSLSDGEPYSVYRCWSFKCSYSHSHQPTLWYSVFLKTVLVTRLIRELLAFMQPECPLPCSQKSHQFNQLKPVYSLIHCFAKNNFNIILQPTPSSLFPWKSPVKFYFAFLICDLLLRVHLLATRLPTR
jgi:hypothetical protein